MRLIPNPLVATSKFQINLCNHCKATQYQKIQTLISKKDFEQNPILKDGKKSKEMVHDHINEEKGD